MQQSHSPAWIEAIKEKTQPELKKRLLYLEHMTHELTELYNNRIITDVNIWVGHVDKPAPDVDNVGGVPVKEIPYNSININFQRLDVHETFLEFIHNFCTTLCAEKLVVESLIVKK